MGKYTLKTEFTAVDKFSSKVEKMARKAETGFARIARSAEKVSQKAFTMGRNTAIATAAMAAPLVYAGKQAVAFEEKMSNVSTLIDETKENMQDMGNEVLNLAKKLPVPIEELTTSLYDVRSAGIEAGDAMNVLEQSSKLSVAGLGSVKEATDFVTSAMNTFKSENLTAAEAANIAFASVKGGKTTISELAQSFGNTAASIEEIGIKYGDFQAATTALTTTGQKASVAQTKLKASISKLNNPTKEMTMLFDKLGVKTGKELIGNSENLVDAFQKMDKASKASGINMAKAWGSSDARDAFVSLIGATNDAYKKATKDMAGNASLLDTAFKKQSETSKASMQKIKNNAEVLAVKLGSKLLPIISKITDSLTPLVDKITNWIDKNPKLATTITKVAVGVTGLLAAVSGVSYVVGAAAKAFKAFQVVMKATRAVAVGFKAATTLLNTAMTGNIMHLRKSRTALIAYRRSTQAAAAAQTTMRNTNPYMLIATAIAAMAYAGYKLYQFETKLGATERVNNEIKKKAIENYSTQVAEARMLFRELRGLEYGTDSYNKKLQQLEKIQPGITNQIKQQKGAVDALTASEKVLTDTIWSRAMAAASAEVYAEKMKKVAELEMEDPNWKDKAISNPVMKAIYSSNPFTKLLPEKFKQTVETRMVSAEASKADRLKGRREEAEAAYNLSQQYKAEAEKPVDLDATIQKVQEDRKVILNFEMEGLPDWMKVSQKFGTDNMVSIPSGGTTN